MKFLKKKEILAIMTSHLLLPATDTKNAKRWRHHLSRILFLLVIAAVLSLSLGQGVTSAGPFIFQSSPAAPPPAEEQPAAAPPPEEQPVEEQPPAEQPPEAPPAAPPQQGGGQTLELGGVTNIPIYDGAQQSDSMLQYVSQLTGSQYTAAYFVTVSFADVSNWYVQSLATNGFTVQSTNPTTTSAGEPMLDIAATDAAGSEIKVIVYSDTAGTMGVSGATQVGIAIMGAAAPVQPEQPAEQPVEQPAVPPVGSTPLPAQPAQPTQQIPLLQTPQVIDAVPLTTPESAGEEPPLVWDMSKFIDTIVIVISYGWLCCGALLLLGLPVLLITLQMLGRRRPRRPPERITPPRE